MYEYEYMMYVCMYVVNILHQQRKHTVKLLSKF